MVRSPRQSLVLPYRLRIGGGWEFAILLRAEIEMWQFVSGGAEDDETPEQTARRELAEELGVDPDLPLLHLDAVASIPCTHYPQGAHWPPGVYVVPESCFAVDLTGREIRLSAEHAAVRWLSSGEAMEILTWDSNRVALWELVERLKVTG